MVDNTLVPKEITYKLEAEFQTGIAKIFGDNLLFAFIGGGIAKGYADYDHDIDAVVVQKEYNEKQTKDYQEFFYALHKKFGFKTEENPTIDISFGIPADQNKLNNMLSILDEFRVQPVIEEFEKFEAIVWGDMLSGDLIGTVGDLSYLNAIQKKCRDLKVKWKSEIISNCISPETYSVESALINEMGITRLFERYVTYLKNKTDSTLPSYKVVIIGDMPKAYDLEQKLKLNQHSIISLPEKDEGTNFAKHFRDKSGAIDNKNFDVVILTSAKYGAEHFPVGLKNNLSKKIIITLSDGFLGSYELVKDIESTEGPAGLPDIVIAFNRANHKDLFDDNIFYVSHYPPERDVRTETYKILKNLLGVDLAKIKLYRSMLHSALDCGSSISMVSNALNYYQDKNTQNDINFSTLVEGITRECDFISSRTIGHGLPSHLETPIKFLNKSDVNDALVYSLIPIEKLGELLKISTPVLTDAINKWSEIQGINLRILSRPIDGIMFPEGAIVNNQNGYILSTDVKALLTEQTAEAIYNNQQHNLG